MDLTISKGELWDPSVLFYKTLSMGPKELNNRDSLYKGFSQKNIILSKRTV